jgi:hypothetical protein
MQLLSTDGKSYVPTNKKAVLGPSAGLGEMFPQFFAYQPMISPVGAGEGGVGAGGGTGVGGAGGAGGGEGVGLGDGPSGQSVPPQPLQFSSDSAQ